ncbi:MAG: hypothetical protein M3P18_09285 [Actinomycetota bacterium]|nr:hypothetical protein [Actinomycetota bacterium]
MNNEDVLSRLKDRYARFEAFVNEDLVNLLGALAALVVRFRESGFTEEEHADERAQVLWAVERGQSRAPQHMIVSLWAALEAYVEDLWIEAASHVTIDSGSALGKVKASIIELHELPEAEHYRKLWEDVQTPRTGTDRYSAVFEMIKAKVTVSNIETLEQAVPTTLSGVPADDQWMLKRLRELQAARNVIVHRGGVVDDRLAAIGGGRWRIGEELTLPADVLVDYGIAVHVYAASALYGVCIRLQLPLEFED